MVTGSSVVGASFTASGARFLAAAAVLLIVTRAAWAAWTPSQPVSDFRLYDDLARTFAAGEPPPYRWPRMAIVAAWGYPVALAAVYAVAGAGVSVAKAFNVALAAAALLAQYLLAREVGGRSAARFAASLFVLWPGQLVYVGVLGSEHLALPLLLFGLWCVSRAIDAEADEPTMVALVGAGALLACAFVTRSALGTALLASLVALSLDRTRRPSRRLARCAVVLGVFAATTASYSALLERSLGAAPVSGGWWSVLVGANAASGGGWNVADVELFTSHPDLASANRFARDEAWRRISSDPDGYVLLAARKIGVLWGDASYPTFWSTVAMEESPAATRLASIAWKLGMAMQVFHRLVLALGVVGVVLAAVGRRARRGAGPLLLFLAIATLAHGVVESQPRYNYPLQPIVFVFAGMALAWLAALKRS
jgi:hypothetical protein